MVLLASLFLLAGCLEGEQEIGLEVVAQPAGTKPHLGMAISDIQKNRESLKGQTISVAGKVLPGLAFEFVGEQPYRIIQGEELLWVVTTAVAPAEGSFVTVRGKLVAPYQIKGRSYEIVLLEEHRE